MAIRVVELFAGVGGFRLGLERSSPLFETIWANQWEPGKTNQYAFDCYIKHFGTSPSHVNEDIAIAKDDVPDHDLLVGGFPCQDYSVARTGAQGIAGKKGVLWWDINDIIRNKAPQYVLLENVDRLIKSPAIQRGRDFAVILRCFNDLGYAVEWRVINAADYGNAQRRRRTFIFAYKNGTPLNVQLKRCTKPSDTESYFDWITRWGFFAPAFAVENRHLFTKQSILSIKKNNYRDLVALSNNFHGHFYNSGVMCKGNVYSEELEPRRIQHKTLRSIRYRGKVDEEYFLNGSLDKWEYLKGAKRIKRIRPNGEAYYYAEGGMQFPDNLDQPSRTMLTSEASVNRSTHVIRDLKTDRLRLLTPIECERLNGFDDNWTKTGMPDKSRYFMMGNALVVPIITRLGNRILEII